MFEVTDVILDMVQEERHLNAMLEPVVIAFYVKDMLVEYPYCIHSKFRSLWVLLVTVMDYHCQLVGLSYLHQILKSSMVGRIKHCIIAGVSNIGSNYYLQSIKNNHQIQYTLNSMLKNKEIQENENTMEAIQELMP